MTTALIIEDHPDNMVLIGRLLEKSGYKTLRAVTGVDEPCSCVSTLQAPRSGEPSVQDRVGTAHAAPSELIARFAPKRGAPRNACDRPARGAFNSAAFPCNSEIRHPYCS